MSKRVVTESAYARAAVEQLENRTLLSAAAMDLIGISELRAHPEWSGYDGSGVSVAVIDTGIDVDHPWFDGAIVENINVVPASQNPPLVHRHGTHVAGTVGGRSDFSVAPDVGLIGLQVFATFGNGAVLAPQAYTEAALQWVLEHHVEHRIVAVNMSLGGGLFSSAAGLLQVYTDEIIALEKAGVTVVSAAGNGYQSDRVEGVGSPAIFSTLAVGAVWADNVGPQPWYGNTETDVDHLIGFSARPATGTTNGLFAPGGDILSALPGGNLGFLSGTSMASPIVAGSVAVLQEAALTTLGRLLTPAEVTELFFTSADMVVDGDDEVDTVPNTGNSYARINVMSAVEEFHRRFPSSGEVFEDPDGVIFRAGPTLPLSATGTSWVETETIGTDPFRGSVGADDVDIYELEIIYPSTIRVAVEETTDFSSGGLAFRLFDESGTQIAAGSSDGLATTGELLTTIFEPGRYYVGISGAGNSDYDAREGSETNGDEGSYELTTSVLHADPDGVFQAATVIELDAQLRAAFSGSIGRDLNNETGPVTGTRDLDVYQIQAFADGRFRIDIDTPVGTGFSDTYVRVFDSAGNLVAENDNGFATDLRDAQLEEQDGTLVYSSVLREWQGHVTDSFIGLNVDGGNTYFVVVSGQAGRDWDPANIEDRAQAGTIESYDLRVQFESWDVNGTLDTARASDPVNMPTWTLPGNIGIDVDPDTGADVPPGGEDVDFYRVVADRNGMMEFGVLSTSRTDVNDPARTTLSIFNSDGSLVTQDLGGQLGGTYVEPRVFMQVRAGEEFLVAVSGQGNAGFDPSRLGVGAAGDTGNYLFRAVVHDGNPDGSLSDNNASLATSLGFDFPLALDSTIGEDGDLVVGAADIDVRSFTPLTGGTYRFEALGTGALQNGVELAVFNEAGERLALGEASGTSSGAVELRMEQGQTYLVVVSGSGNTSYDPIGGLAGLTDGEAGPYTLNASAIAQDAQVGPGDAFIASYAGMLGDSGLAEGNAIVDQLTSLVSDFAYGAADWGAENYWFQAANGDVWSLWHGGGVHALGGGEHAWVLTNLAEAGGLAGEIEFASGSLSAVVTGWRAFSIQGIVGGELVALWWSPEGSAGQYADAEGILRDGRGLGRLGNGWVYSSISGEIIDAETQSAAALGSLRAFSASQPNGRTNFDPRDNPQAFNDGFSVVIVTDPGEVYVASFSTSQRDLPGVDQSLSFRWVVEPIADVPSLIPVLGFDLGGIESWRSEFELRSR